MRILGIETSCDETAAAIVEDGTKILSNVVASSSDMHAKTGGIIPENAARAQVESIVPVIQLALKESSTMKQLDNRAIVKLLHGSIVKNIDAIAVTVGPGLIGSLLVGVETARTLSYLWKKPLIPVNHLVAHIYANWIVQGKKGERVKRDKLPEFPLLALVVSGGHTDLVLMKNHAELKWIGGTRDDAAGEAFDKCARLLGLPYPGGPAIAAEAAKFNLPARFAARRDGKAGVQSSKFKLKMFPRPMINSGNFDWSFSGLKTAVLNKVKRQESEKVKERLTTPQLAAEIQEAIVDVLVTKSQKAIKKYKPKSFLLSGGVAANLRLRKKLKSSVEDYNNDAKQKVKLFIPNVKYCTDNAAVIASAAFFNNKPIPWKKLNANPQLTILN